jgi:predicted transcriptional regulator
MPTSVHIPRALLRAVDRRARALKISRNKLIVQALEREVQGAGGDWPAGFLERLADVEPGIAESAQEMLGAIIRSRSSKKRFPL